MSKRHSELQVDMVVATVGGKAIDELDSKGRALEGPEIQPATEAGEGDATIPDLPAGANAGFDKRENYRVGWGRDVCHR